MSDATPGRNEILQVIEPRFECLEMALEWFNSRALPGYSGATARDLLEAGRGREVLNYITSIGAGIHA